MDGYKRWLIVVLVAVFSKAYLGFHGPSVQQYPEIHAGMTEDDQCRICHHPDNAGKVDKAPATTHPEFKNCLKCHNDPLEQKTDAK